MEQYEDELLAQWQADTPQRKGYRQLADWLNTLLLRREMDRAGLSTLGDEAEFKYERLRSDDVIADEVAAELQNAGVPIGQLRSDFVSYGVIRMHLKEYLNSDVSLSSGDWERDAIEITLEHSNKKINEAVRSLRNKGKLAAGGNVSVAVSAEIERDNCHASVPATRTVRRGYV